MDEIKWTTVKKWLGFIVTLPLSVVLGFDLAFTVYAVPMKEKFNYTQTEVEVIASAGIIGFGVSVFQPSILKLCGINLTYIISGLVGTGGLLLLMVSCLYNNIFKNLFIVVSVFQLAACSGIAIAAALTASISVSHFELSTSGKIVAVYAAMYALGKVFFVYVYEFAFEEDNDLAGFFLVTAFSFSILLVICAFLHRPKVTPRAEEISLVKENGSTGDTEQYDARNNQTMFSLKHILSSLKGNTLFHFTFWPATIIYSCSVAIMNNLTTIVPSETAKPSTTIVLFSVMNAVTRVLVGALLDANFMVRINRKLLVQFAFGAFFILVMAIYLLDADDDAMAMFFSIGSGICVGALFVIPVAMITYIFGKAYYSFTFGVFLGTAAMSVLVVQVISGLVYDACEEGTVWMPVDVMNCFFWPLVMFIGISGLMLIFVVGNMVHQTKSSKQTASKNGVSQ